MSYLAEEVRQWLTKTYVGTVDKVATDEIYDAYAAWAEERNLFVRNSQAFGLAIKAVVPGIRKVRVMHNKARHWYYIFPRDDFDDIL